MQRCGQPRSIQCQRCVHSDNREPEPTTTTSTITRIQATLEISCVDCSLQACTDQVGGMGRGKYRQRDSSCGRGRPRRIGQGSRDGGQRPCWRCGRICRGCDTYSGWLQATRSRLASATLTSCDMYCCRGEHHRKEGMCKTQVSLPHTRHSNALSERSLSLPPQW